MKILAIETSCDETCAAVTEELSILSNVIWSQIDLHREFGGVVPSIARRAHQDKIDWVVDKALKEAGVTLNEIGAVAVTVGPGLAIALEVGITKAKQLATQWQKPLLAINHVEGHIVSSLVNHPQIICPAMALVVSGGHTELILVTEIGKYQIVARTIDDALGEALDKAARMLGLGYPGGAELEKLAREGNIKRYKLPLPMAGRESQNEFSYSGLKSAFFRLVNSPGEKSYPDLAAAFQNRAFEHLTRVMGKTLNRYQIQDLLVGGGVAANKELSARLQKLGGDTGLKVHLPAKGLYGDNAAMIGMAAGFKAERREFVKNIEEVDRQPRLRVDQV
ncbi:MAG: tRNA (adenosine(37)-N6)-threonylcarbamoyltransferase complex transferase subunit TsaD [bacterium]|nr:tRNA (adenosine(37)-N6)-threonylcarbamoyltransferase complex transferase subunit TsaD [bacterium]